MERTRGPFLWLDWRVCKGHFQVARSLTLCLVRPMTRIGIAGLMIMFALAASAKQYVLYPEFSARKVVFSAPPDMPHVFESPYREVTFRARRSVLPPQLTIRVERLYGENPSDPKDYVEDFAATINIAVTEVDGAAKLIKDSPEPEITEVDASNGSPIHSAPIWCVRTEKHHDYLITELIDQEIQIQITFEALDADELLPKIATFKAFTKSVRIVPR